MKDDRRTAESGAPERDDAPARDNEGPSGADRKRRPLVEAKPGKQLSAKEEKDHIDTQQPPEIPARQVDGEAVSSKSQDAQSGREESARAGRPV